ncbi:MAG: 3D-(3,5/4)-trihydroxycyclohexane-1,2-dione acylhydrolase (decyclizing) [Acidimicrobiia bacterium]|nr:3D-(3,5/4)-trihydroxycyclohexane-1,2-dione acylhydrolase (decyclizing) [Acidimicrobiia bacterium]
MARTLSTERIRLTVAQAIVKYLQMQFSERDGRTRRLIPGMFGIFGHGNVAGMGQALTEYGQELTYFQPCNEQAMVHTAIGYAKATQRTATLACSASIGPGSTNMITGAATATINRLPVLLLPSDYYATRYQGPVLQQLEHPISADVSVNDCFRPVSRFFDRISRPEQLLTALPEAMRVLTDPADTGAVTLALPQDVQQHAYDFPANLFEKRMWRIERRLPDPQRIKEAVELLRVAKRPMIVAGGGVHYSQAWEELQAFSDALGIPVGETFGGRGALRNPSPLYMGGFAVTGAPCAGKIASQADLIICVGTRLTDFATGSQSAFNNPDVRFLNLNVTGHDAFKQGALPLVADAREALRSLAEAAKSAGLKPNASYVQEAISLRQAWDKRLAEEVFKQVPGEAMSQGQLIGVLNEEAKSGDIIVAAAGSPPGDLMKIWDATNGRACQLEFGYSCMAYEIPAGIGARMSQPDGEVFVFIGDGTYLMNPTEIVTAVQEGLKITIVISENHGYQCIRGLQLDRAGHSFGNEFRSRDKAANRLEGEYLKIDFAQNAASMGARTWNVNTPEGLRKALQEARRESRTCVIVVETEKYRFLPGSEVWWDVAVAEVSNDPVTQKLRADYDRNRSKLQRFHY